MTIKKDHFTISKEKQYPPFFRVIQSIYSPLLGNVSQHSGQEENSYTALITLGLWRDDSKRYGISICSLLNSKISDSVELTKRINLMKRDYLNTTLKKSEYIRPASELVIERKASEKGPFPLYGEIEDFTFFFPEYNGGDNLAHRLPLVLPLFKKIHLMTIPGEDELRADDKFLLNMVTTFPGFRSHALVSALSQGVLYADRRWFR
jgi:hypothetical protein